MEPSNDANLDAIAYDPEDEEPLIPQIVVQEGGLDPGQSHESKPLTPCQVVEQRKKYGRNYVPTNQRSTWYSLFITALLHPFNVLLTILSCGSAILGDRKSTVVMLVMVLISLVIRLFQQWKARKEANSLLKLVSNTANVIRYKPFKTGRANGDDISLSSCDTDIEAGRVQGIEYRIDIKELPIEEIVPGDWIRLSVGDVIPADILLIESKDLYVSQATLNGESLPAEKAANAAITSGPNAIAPGGEGIIQISVPQELVAPLYASPGHLSNVTRRSCRTRMRIFFRNLFGLRVERYMIFEQSVRAELDNPGFCFMGTSVVSGTATAIVRFTGRHTYFGSMARELGNQRPPTAFDLGVRRISWIFFLVMMLLVPPIFLLQAYMHPDGGIGEAALFAMAAAVGLTPEMLPTIVNATLARGAFLMSRKKSIVRNMDSIINLGGMDILCTDKTGTLTENKVSLLTYVDCYGNKALFPIQLALLNSHFQSGFSNLMDKAIIDFFKVSRRSIQNMSGRPTSIVAGFTKVDEIPFDFVRRCMSVLVQATPNPDPKQQTSLLVTKGAVEEILSRCKLYYAGNPDPDRGGLESRSKLLLGDSPVLEISEGMRARLITLSNSLNTEGLRVIAVAYKQFIGLPPVLRTSDEDNLILAGFITFQDPPKSSTRPAIENMLLHNVTIKILTGDSAAVCLKVCEDIKLPVTGIVNTTDLENASMAEIQKMVEKATIFAKLTPIQKAQVVRALKINGHCVGFLGDGINDSNALMESDVGISVENGADIARESADIILLEKDLTVVADGIIEGRLTYGNTMKYIVMAMSSNFGNSFSLLAASAWFPFAPMLPMQLLGQNLLYDISQITLPWDRMDPEFLMVPHRWSMKAVLRFMLCMGPWSSVFDVTTFAYLYFYQNIRTTTDNVRLFHTIWFLTGILTQSCVVHMLRTRKIPFFQSRASGPVLAMTGVIASIAISLPYIPKLSEYLEFVQPPALAWPFILLVVLTYCLTTQIMKTIYLFCFKEWF